MTPENPAVQLHPYPDDSITHEELCMHGLLEHTSVSARSNDYRKLKTFLIRYHTCKDRGKNP